MPWMMAWMMAWMAGSGECGGEGNKKKKKKWEVPGNKATRRRLFLREAGLAGTVLAVWPPLSNQGRSHGQYP